MLKLKTWLLAILCPVLQCYAQNSSSSIIPLRVGDTLDDIAFTPAFNAAGINRPVSKIRLSDIKSKLIILDYWATWCGSCLKMIPKLDSLQRELSPQLQILLIGRQGNGDDTSKVTKTFARLNFPSPQTFPIPIILNDSFALRHYELMVLPHYIWLNEHRVILGITDSGPVNKSTIKSVLCALKMEEPVVLPLKEDQFGK